MLGGDDKDVEACEKVCLSEWPIYAVIGAGRTWMKSKLVGTEVPVG